MELTIDKAGRIVIPKKVRDALRLQAGDTLRLEQDGDLLEIRPVRHEAPMRRKGRFLVFRSGLSPADAAKAVEDMREERIQELLRSSTK